MNPEAFEQLITPCLLLDKDILERNIERMHNKALSHDVQLRTHLKTAKSVDVAALLKKYGHTGVTVSTLTEAEYFAEAGYDDILYAVSIEPSKFLRVKKLYQKGIKLKVILDDVEVARKLAEWASAETCPVECLIEIDSDGHRAGIAADDAQLLVLARILAEASHVTLSGVMTHGGGAYYCADMQQARQHAELEREQCVKAAERIRQAEIHCPIISIGSTPTVVAAQSFENVTEIRPGVYVFFDLFQMGLGVCSMDDIALTVLARVIGHHRKQNRIFIDAGGLALSKDRSTCDQKQDFGYGLVCSVDAKPILSNLIVSQVNQEHGVINTTDEAMFDILAIGSLVRIMPNHACMTAAAYNNYFVVDGEGLEVSCWNRCNGWSQWC
ncbi:alanine racemase [Alteromonas sp. a30]|uniref:alanine racemase n=1 Tax=Alteromonas sp. a30 TaxID=2730917 RepID=UPI0022826139|nr:alanine racemase [Alteromonas sp. a30]MCY7295553.1 hypothetical protein [Alteromonas sp. a30]